MIVADSSRGLLLVRQADHAELSARIAGRWQAPPSLQGELWSTFIEAVRHHDDGWTAEEEQPALDPAGKPFDFKRLPVARHVAVWRRTIDLARGRGPSIELIIARHGRWLYTRFPRGGTAEEREIVSRFLDEVSGRIDLLVAELEAGSPAGRAAAQPEALEASRRLLSFFDALSLALLGGLPFFRSTEPLPFGEREEPLGIEPAAGGARILPWPFTGSLLTLECRGILTSRRQFRGPDEVMEGAISPIHPLTFRIVPGPGP